MHKLITLDTPYCVRGADTQLINQDKDHALQT